MSEDIKTRALNYLNCPLGDMHEGEQLNFVCIDSTCKEMGLICPVCRSQKHAKHKVIPLKIFLADISVNVNGKQNQNSIDSLLTQLDQTRARLLSTLKETVQKMVLQIKILEDQINLSHKNTRQRLLEQNQTQMNFPQIFQQILNSQYKNVDQLKQDVRKIIDNVSQLQAGKIEIDFKPQKLYDQYQKASQESISQFNQLLTQFKQSLYKIFKPIEKYTVPLQASNSTNFTFSTVLKSPTINITEQKIAHQTANQNSENRFILIEPQIVESCKIAIKISNLSNFIGIGIAYKNVLLGKNMKFDHQNLGHGSYMISSNAHTWSHSKKEENMVQKAFNFTTGDIIIVEIMLENKTLKFTCKNKPNETQAINLTFDNPDNDDIHFCVNMCYSGEKVEILDDLE
ncbi:unnamed protein product (macronuclear) [Paramecium tetraurelia]|uniref:B box-type domain-containing protein n=1 Tax=Paramecium tetraurelia TaxID=5888 RepID=A0C5F8_PARTE|nr:uncharacterized protein GSPATT00006524001 [Paramecium tetraurelia]CAK66025.1 unnamed protein product [Paramecium tetraurelia]|eukprot:XP_001433422.1 hypothetical protein (macronuclear) [Paramecium tetraurelia strain d4-2]